MLDTTPKLGGEWDVINGSGKSPSLNQFAYTTVSVWPVGAEGG